MPKFRPLPPLKELQKSFHYDPETGDITRNGCACGWRSEGYICIQYRGRKYRAHRIAWYLATGQDPLDKMVDHIDRNRANNALKNLRLATAEQNAQNKAFVGYTDTFKGCYRPAGYLRYAVHVRVDGRNHYVGCFATTQEAERAYREKVVELRGEFAPIEWKTAS